MTAPILIPHDLTDLGDQALAAAADLPWIGAPRVVLHVLPRVDVRYPGVVWSTQDDGPRTRHAMEELTRRTAEKLPGAALQVVIGDPASRIVEVARAFGCRLIVVPSHSRKGLDRFVLGSVAEYVARFASCPVLILPAGTAPPPPAKELHLATGRTRSELIDELGTEICAQVDAHRGAFLTALRIGLPATEDTAWWERALAKRLADAGVEFVDVVFTANPRPAVLDARFEQRWA